QSGGTFTVTNSAQLNATADWTRNGGLFNAGTGTVTFTPRAFDPFYNPNPPPITIGGTSPTTFNNLTLSYYGGIYFGSNSVNLAPGANPSVTGNLLVTGQSAIL